MDSRLVCPLSHHTGQQQQQQLIPGEAPRAASDRNLSLQELLRQHNRIVNAPKQAPYAGTHGNLKSAHHGMPRTKLEPLLLLPHPPHDSGPPYSGQQQQQQQPLIPSHHYESYDYEPDSPPLPPAHQGTLLPLLAPDGTLSSPLPPGLGPHARAVVMPTAPDSPKPSVTSNTGVGVGMRRSLSRSFSDPMNFQPAPSTSEDRGTASASHSFLVPLAPEDSAHHSYSGVGSPSRLQPGGRSRPAMSVPSSVPVLQPAYRSQMGGQQGLALPPPQQDLLLPPSTLRSSCLPVLSGSSSARDAPTKHLLSSVTCAGMELSTKHLLSSITAALAEAEAVALPRRKPGAPHRPYVPVGNASVLPRGR